MNARQLDKAIEQRIMVEEIFPYPIDPGVQAKTPLGPGKSVVASLSALGPFPMRLGVHALHVFWMPWTRSGRFMSEKTTLDWSMDYAFKLKPGRLRPEFHNAFSSDLMQLGEKRAPPRGRPRRRAVS
ncbi:hypothetical protein [Sulfuritalea sp.]|uniref:hypothetical protein n=1 Tax=Sulfuritalea sp. TaxID=2480090 RepID=UPI0025F5CB83|nr:hypothetical protein [Sulfuritalea sp.]